MKAEYISHQGDDLAVVNAARVSFDKESDWDLDCVCDRGPCSSGCPYGEKRLSHADGRLIAYLAKHEHWTPFAHNSITLRMQAPVPIRTQCFKHKIGFVENEESRRYISSRPELFVPDHFRSKPDGSIKQGSGGKHIDSDEWLAYYSRKANEAIDDYEWMVKSGVCPEQARLILPQGVEVNWIWTGNLYAFANFYNKRIDSHAQVEIQDLAKEVGKIIEPLFPCSWRALTQ